jgi:hypothetical protein
LDDLDCEIGAHFSSNVLNPEAQSFVPKPETHGNDESHLHVHEVNPADSENNYVESSASNVPNSVFMEEPEVGEDQRSSCSGDFQDDPDDDEVHGFIEEQLEDEAVLQINIDKIIEELRKFIRRRQEASIQKLPQTTLSEIEFPPLTSKNAKYISQEREASLSWPSRRKSSYGFDFGSLHSDYQIRVVNGREEIQLLDIYKKPSERAQQSATDAYQQKNLEPELLMHMLENDPSRYLTGKLLIGNEKSRIAYAVIQDKQKPDIQVRGSIRHAFDQDTVVIDVKQNDEAKNRDVGVLIGKLPSAKYYFMKLLFSL